MNARSLSTEVAVRALCAAEQAIRAARELLAAQPDEANHAAGAAAPVYYDSSTYPLGKRRFYADARRGAFRVFKAEGSKRLLARSDEVQAYIERSRVERTSPAPDETARLDAWLAKNGLHRAPPRGKRVSR